MFSSNINDLPFEILIHIFSFLPSHEIISVARVCRGWADLVSDDLIWEKAFMKFWGRNPDVYMLHNSNTLLTRARRISPETWKQEYLARNKLIAPWRGARRQRVHCNVQQLGKIAVAHIWRANDGRLRLMAASQTGMLSAFFEPGGKLNRSISYLSGMKESSGTIDVEHQTQKLAVGNESGLVEVYSNQSGFVKVSEFRLDLGPRVQVEDVRWHSPNELVIVAHGLEQTYFSLWNVIEIKIISEFRVERYIPRLSKVCIVDNTFFWLEDSKLSSSGSALNSMADVLDIFPVKSSSFLAILNGLEWLLINKNGTQRPINIPGTTGYTLGFGKSVAECTRILYLDQEGWQWLMSCRIDEGTGLKYDFVRCTQGLHASLIVDVFFGKSVIIILRASVLAIHDATSMGLLLWQPVQNARGNSDEESGGGTKKILHVIEEEGLLLFQWNSGRLQVWNFGRALGYLETTGKTFAGRAGSRKASISQQIRAEYADWQQEQQEQAELERLRSRHNPEGMGEEELLALAISLSLAEAEDSRSVSSFQEISTDDEELRRVLELSRHDV